MAYGLGVSYELDSGGNVIDCDSWSNIFNLACWGFPGAGQLPSGTTPGSGPGGSTPAPPAAACGPLDYLFNSTATCTTNAGAIASSLTSIALIVGGVIAFVAVMGAVKR